jgi:hypothetical protein
MTNSKPTATTCSTDAKPRRAKAQPIAAKTAAVQEPHHSRQPSKLELIRSLLARPDGATLDELVSATRWQVHSVRAGMTGLRKQGLTITRSKREGMTRFIIDSEPAEAAA